MLSDFIDSISGHIDGDLSKNRYLLLGNAFNKFSVILYQQNSAKPSYVAKVAMTDKSRQRCNDEFLALKKLESTKIPLISAARPISKFQLERHFVYLQSFVDHELMLDELPLYFPRFVRRHFDVATRALVNIYRETNFTDQKNEISQCFQHGDFWLGNIAYHDEALHLLDLEFAKEDGYPLFDLLHFGIYYYRVIQNIGKYKRLRPGQENHATDQREIRLQTEDVSTVFCCKSRYSRELYRSIHRYTDDCGLSDQQSLKLIETFLASDRDIDGYSESLAADMKKTYFYWRKS